MRNHPEEYLVALAQHFATAPQIIGSAEVESEANAGDLITTNQQGKFTAFQRWFSFKEAFSPSFVMGAIQGLGYKPTHIIDPFGGSGTTAITSQLLDIPVTTIEINPFTADLILAKAIPISYKKFQEIQKTFYKRLLEKKVDWKMLAHLPPSFVESDKNEKWIFDKKVAGRITQYLATINSFRDASVKRVLKMILAASLIPASNVYIDGKGRRYRKNWEEYDASSKKLDDLIRLQFEIVLEDSKRFENRPRSEVKVINSDARAALKALKKPADLIVFSPPYPNTFDYTDIYNVELWVLGYLKNSKDNRDLRSKTLRSHVQSQWESAALKVDSIKLKEIHAELHQKKDLLWNKNIPNMVLAYFKDMEDILTESFRLLKDGGKLIMVVGDSKYVDVLIDVSVVLTDIATNIGYTKIVNKEVRKMRTSAQQGGGKHLGEWIIELSK
jgi:DNA modification methylase